MKTGRKVAALLLSLSLLLSQAGCGRTEQAGSASSAARSVSVAEGGSRLSMADEVERYRAAVDEAFAYSEAETLSTDKSLLSGKQGFRTAGSDAEHAGANFLAQEMKRIGLKDVEKVPVSVDKWEYKGASLTVEGTGIDIAPASYMAGGTGGVGFDAPMVDAGSGFAADYENVDVEGKIALVGVDLRNEAWMDQYIYEAYAHDAAALLTYDIGEDTPEDTIHIENVRCADLMPVAAISRSQYQALAQAIEEGYSNATLSVDSVVQAGMGTSYNVVGMLKGRSSDQQILIAGHYDLYFNGFQADCTGMGVVLGIAKAMVDSGYVPENDIVFVAHGADEWGATDTAFDRERGAWELLQTRPEWEKKTLALFDLELAGVNSGAAQYQIGCVPEYAGLVKTLVSDTGLLAVDSIYERGVSPVSAELTSAGDSMAYRSAGIPCLTNVSDTGPEPGAEPGESWEEQHYRTDTDTVETYSPEVMTSNLNAFGAMAIYVDQTPALALDLTATCAEMSEAVNESLDREAGVDVDAYRAALAGLRTAAEGWNERIAAVNAAYEQAAMNGASQEELDRLRDQGAALNRTTLKAFRYAQRRLTNIVSNGAFVVSHVGYQDQVELLTDLLAALNKGEFYNSEKTGALDLAQALNGGTEYGYYEFSPETADKSRAHYDAAVQNLKYWGEKRGYVLADTSRATLSLLEKEESPETSVKKEREIYQAARTDQMKRLAKQMIQETQSMEKLTQLLQTAKK